MKHYYRFNHYINAKHSVNFQGKESPIHPHTWEIVVSLRVEDTDFISFTSLENLLEGYFEQYEGKYLNELQPFKDNHPTMEYMGQLFYKHLNTLMKGMELTLYRIEISENPTRTYIIESDEVESNERVH